MAAWESLRCEMTAEAEGPVQNLSPSLRLSSYYKIADRMFLKASEFGAAQDWRSTYVHFKRYAILVTRTLPKHQSFGDKEYRIDRAAAKRRAKEAIDWIKRATTALQAQIANPTVKKMDRKSSVTGGMQTLTRRLSFLQDDNTALTALEKRMRALQSGETNTKEIEVPEANSAPLQPSPPSPPALRQLTQKDLDALAALNIQSSAYAVDQSKKKRDNGSSNLYNNFTSSTTSNTTFTPYIQTLKQNSLYNFTVPPNREISNSSSSLIASSTANGLGIYKSQVSHLHPDVQKQEADRLLRSDLLKEGFRVVDCKPDGNCLFRAVSQQVHGNEEYHARVRQMVCNYMRQHQSRFIFLADPPTPFAFENYLKVREKPVSAGHGEWGGHPEIVVIEELYDRVVEIYSAKDGVKARKTHLDDELPEEIKHVTPIRLHYQGGNHYNAIVNENVKRFDSEKVPLGLRNQGVIRRFRELTC
eukprot:g1378.t1